MTPIPLNVGKKRTLTVTPNGTVVGEPVWTASVDGIGGLFPLPGGLSCDLTNIAPGVVTVTATASNGARPIIISADFQCLPAPIPAAARPV